MVKELAKRALFAFRNVDFGYEGRPLLVKNLSFAIGFGQSVALLTTEGAGRSTLLKLMLGILAPNRGQVFVNEFPISKLPDSVIQNYRAQVGFLVGNGGLISNLTIFENVALPLRYHSHFSDEMIEVHVSQILAQFRIAPYQHLRPAFVSEYVRCIAGIARATVMSPPAFLVDNIFDGLSRKHVVQAVAHLQRIRDVSEAAFVYTANDPELLYHLTDRVLFLHEGQLVFDGSFDDFFQSPSDVIQAYLKETFVQKELHVRKAAG
jgi:ABC-type transporter Mla maintaining outer membrane lipid asymmetry ATPase subunit MlaF